MPNGIRPVWFFMRPPTTISWCGCSPSGARELSVRGFSAWAHLEPGHSVLDVGCGTGTLAIAAKRHVGPTGTVSGIDASSEMLARAEKKARRAGIKVDWKLAAAQALPFPDAQFDAVLNTVMLHHLPRKGREQCAGEMRRVLKPGGHLLVVDFAGSGRESGSLLAHFHRHGHVSRHDVVALLDNAGLSIVESGTLRFRDLQFVLAAARPYVTTG